MLGQRKHQLSNLELDKLLIEGKQKLRYFRLPKMFFCQVQWLSQKSLLLWGKVASWLFSAARQGWWDRTGQTLGCLPLSLPSLLQMEAAGWVVMMVAAVRPRSFTVPSCSSCFSRGRACQAPGQSPRTLRDSQTPRWSTPPPWWSTQTPWWSTQASWWPTQTPWWPTQASWWPTQAPWWSTPPPWWSTPGLHKLWYPSIRDTSTWSKFGAHGEHGDVFLFSNLGALWFSENLIRHSLHICLREVKNNFFPSNTLIYGISRDGSKNLNIRTCEHMILGQLRIWAHTTTYAALVWMSPAWSRMLSCDGADGMNLRKVQKASGHIIAKISGDNLVREDPAGRGGKPGNFLRI